MSYFGATAGSGYVNAKKGFESCILSFADGARIEAMKTSTLDPVAIEPGAQRMGLPISPSRSGPIGWSMN